MDLATLIGLVVGVIMILFGIISGAGVSALGHFFDCRQISLQLAVHLPA